MTREELVAKIEHYGLVGINDKSKRSDIYLYMGLAEKDFSLLHIVTMENGDLYFMANWIIYPADKIDEFMMARDIKKDLTDRVRKYLK